MQLSKRLKIILLFSIIIYCFIVISKDIYKTNYNIGSIDTELIIKNIEITGDKVVIVSKEIIINYYLDSEAEKKHFETFQLGDYLKVTGNLSYPSENTLFNQFNYKDYLKSKKIYYILDATEIKKTKENNNLLYTIKNNLKTHINNNPNQNYLNTFILGDKSYLGEEITNSFQLNGISHLLALSGMHVTLLVNIVSKVIKKHTVISIFLLFYAFLANFTPSIIRAVGCFVFKNKINNQDLLFLIAFILLLYNPFIIYDIGFIFSFTITFYLLKFPPNENNYLKKLLKTSFVCFVVSIPILMMNFYYLNFLSIILNLIFVPLIAYFIFPLLLITLIIPIDITFLTTTLESLSLFFNDYGLIFSF